MKSGHITYPRGSFYPISRADPTIKHEITKACFRTCSTCLSHSQAHYILLRLCPNFFMGKVYLCTPPLRFWRKPPQLNCPPDLVSSPVFIRQRVRSEKLKERCFIVDESPSYATQLSFQNRAKLQ